MGIGLSTARYISGIVKDLGITGDVLTLGRQDVWLDEAEFCNLVQSAGLGKKRIMGSLRLNNSARDQRMQEIRRSGNALRSCSHDPRLFVTDEFLFNALGFESCTSADVSDYEGASIIHDFNQPGLGRAADREFEFVFDGGTAEHVFHFPNFLRNVFEVTKVGGYALHASPSNNHVDHGFYQFSPTVFYDWYEANRWDIVRAEFFRYTPSVNEPWQYSEYTPGSLDPIAFGGLDGALYGVMFLARKRPDSTFDVIPQQSWYRRIKWADIGA